MQFISTTSTGQAIVLSNSDIQFPVFVTRISPIVSEITRTQRIWLAAQSLPPNIILREGIQLTLALNVHVGGSAIAIPQTAVLRDGIHAFVFVQKVDGYVDRRRVVTGRSDGEWIEIKSGVSEGEEVIIAGGRELQTAFASLR
jgi:Cu(I)/Ag(I) efflux system membrane fusion protein